MFNFFDAPGDFEIALPYNKQQNCKCTTYIYNLKCKEQFWWQIFKRRGSSLDLGGKLDLFGSESMEAEIKLGLTLISNLGRGRKQKKGGLQLLFRVRNFNLD